MRKRTVIVGLVMLCLALTGVGYAAWSRTLQVKGYATAQNIGIEWSNAVVADHEDDTDITYSSDNRILNYSVTGLYYNYDDPWEETLTCTMTNVGQVPLDVAAALLEGNSPTEDIGGVLRVTVDDSGVTSLAPDETHQVVIQLKVIGNPDPNADYEFTVNALATQAATTP